MKRPFIITRNPPGRGGFTLVEILVVGVIVAVLAALILPVFNAFTERSQGVVCANNMRQLGTALHSYRGEHNGWFPPGYPVAHVQITAGNQQPGAEHQPGASEFRLSPYLVPGYLDAMPVCPGFRLTAAGKSNFPDEKKRLQQLQGGYGVNLVLLQVPLVALPWPGWPSWVHYNPGRVPFLLETGGYASTTWSFEHQTQALNGIGGIYVKGRNHGPDGALNYMFLDGHIKRIARHDRRDVPEANKTWKHPLNPDGLFNDFGNGGRDISHRPMSAGEFRALYPRFYPPPTN